MTDRTHPEAGSTHIIRYALELGLLWIDGDGRNKVREALAALDALEAQLVSIVAGGVQALSAAPATVSSTQHSQFLSDVLTAAGLVTHGKQCKALGERLADMVMRLRAAPQPAPAPLSDDVVKDAARYRWLRENWFTMTSNYQRCITFKVGEPRWSDITEEELDAAIDAALAAQQ